MPRTLIAGGTGFIGQNLAIHLHENGHKIVAIGARKRICAALDSRNIETHFFDLATTPLTAIIGDTGFDYVINLSGYIDHRQVSNNGWSIFETHTKSAINLIHNIDHQRLRTFVQIGSSDEYGDTLAPQNENQREQCLAPYSLAKLTNTHLVQTLARNEGFPGVVVRPFLVFGPGQSTNRLIPFVIQQCLNCQTFNTSPGEQLRDFLFIDDFCDGLTSLFDHGDLFGNIFNIASGTGTPVRQIIETIISEIGYGKANFGNQPYRKGESMALFADISAIKKATGWQPRITIEAGLQRTIDSFKTGI
jgi:nucleoside-diphosphate-sugar epimerase